MTDTPTAGPLPGSLPELLNTAEALAQAGRPGEAMALYRAWLAQDQSPQRFAAEFNLAVLLNGQGALEEAEQGYRRALALQPGLAQGYQNLAVLLQGQQRYEEALNCWSVLLGRLDLASERARYVATLNQMGQLLELLGRPERAQGFYARSLEQEVAQPEIAAREAQLRRQATAAAARRLAGRRADPDDRQAPMVSILIPTHNRPDYAEEALHSALAQSWPNVEIVISDNSDDELTAERFAPYVAANPCIRYFRIASCPALENFLHCYRQARGEFINYLMDDDLFHPDKIANMMAYMQQYPTVGLVTSYRQMVDDHGRVLPDGHSTQRLLQAAGVVRGAEMARHLLGTGLNTIGEPTTVLFRRSALREQFGRFHGFQYAVISDMVSWLAIMAQHDCAYLPEPLSYFRIHGEQGQNLRKIQILGALENLRVLCDAWQHTPDIFQGFDIRALVSAKLTHYIGLMAAWRADIPRSQVEPEAIHALIRQATTLLLDNDR